MTQPSTPVAEGQPRRSAALAAILSFFVPGLGQIYAGRFLRGLIIAIPQVVVIAVLVMLYLRSPAFLAGVLLQYGLAIAVINVLLLLYRGFAVLDAYLLASDRGRATSRGTAVVGGAVILAVLLVANVAVHGAAAYTSYLAWNTASTVFPDDCEPGSDLPTRGCPTPAPTTGAQPTGTPLPTPTLVPGTTPGPTAAPTATPDPAATPIAPGTAYWAENGRLDLLLIGADAGPGRSGLRTDAMMVLSVDLATGRSAITGLPRNVTHVPLPAESAGAYACACWPGMLSSLHATAVSNPDKFPGDEDRGFRALSGAIETLLTISLDGIVVVDLNGFVRTVDALGGIDMNIDKPLYDATYVTEDGSTVQVLDFKPGALHLDGHLALAYVRSRHQDSDYGRMTRQQDFLHAARQQYTACRILPRLPQLLESLKNAVRTDIPFSEVPALLELAGRMRNPRRLVLTPLAGFPVDFSSDGTIDEIRAAFAEILLPRGDGLPNASPDPSEVPQPTAAGC